MLIEGAACRDWVGALGAGHRIDVVGLETAAVCREQVGALGATGQAYLYDAAVRGRRTSRPVLAGLLLVGRPSRSCGLQ